jgi:hypothetical protein
MEHSPQNHTFITPAGLHAWNRAQGVQQLLAKAG